MNARSRCGWLARQAGQPRGQAAWFVGACTLAAALISGMSLVPVFLLAGAFVAAATLAGGLAGLLLTPAVAWLTYRWAVADAERAARRARRLAAFPAIGTYAIASPPDAAVAQLRAVLEDVTDLAEVKP